MALLMSYAMKNKNFRKIVSTKSYSLKTNMNVYKWTNKHKLLYSYKYMTGGKTGFTKIAKRTLVTTASNNNICFTEGVYCEDKLFSVKAVYYANKIVTVPDVHYYYWENPASTVNTPKTKKHIKIQQNLISLFLFYHK